jgi:hypothetical protein
METSSNDQRPTTTRRNFPSKLYTMLQQMELEGHDNIILWQPNGRSFLVHNVKAFEEMILPRFVARNNQMFLPVFLRLKSETALTHSFSSKIYH